MGVPIRELNATKIGDKILLSKWIPIKKDDGKYYMPPNTPLGYDMWIPNISDLTEEEGTIPIEIIQSDEETGVWLVCENDFFAAEQWLRDFKPKYKENSKKFDYKKEHYDEVIDLYNNLHVSTDIETEVGDIIPITLKRKTTEV